MVHVSVMPLLKEVLTGLPSVPYCTVSEVVRPGHAGVDGLIRPSALYVQVSVMPLLKEALSGLWSVPYSTAFDV